MNSKIKVISKVARNSLQVDLIKSLIIEAQKIRNDIEKYREFIFLNFFQFFLVTYVLFHNISKKITKK